MEFTFRKRKRVANIEPSVFGDPLASETDWAPLVRGGSNYCNHDLILEDKRIVFATNKVTKAMVLIPVVLGPLFGYAGYDTGEYIWYILSILCILGFFAFLKYVKDVIVFDLVENCCWVGPDRFKPSGRVLALDKVHAIQFLSEVCYSSNSSNTYKNYELNLVLKDGSRFNALEVGNYIKAKEYLEKIQELTGFQVWNAVEVEQVGAHNSE